MAVQSEREFERENDLAEYRAHVLSLERELAEARAEIEQLRADRRCGEGGEGMKIKPLWFENPWLLIALALAVMVWANW